MNSRLALTLSTLAFAISFAVWGMISPMAKTFQGTLHLTETQTWLLIAVPVLLGSIGRLPVGMATDRFGGRIVFSALMLFVAFSAVMLSFSRSYESMLIWALLVGIAGASFAVGVAFTSPWFPRKQQGLALGVYGVGNIGQSVALFGVPVLSGMFGWQVTFRIFAAVAAVWGVLFLVVARDAHGRATPKSLGEMIEVLARNRISWLLSLFYFVTFGGFVALSIGLPTILVDLFGLTARDAGLRVAGFVVVATTLRPVGGWASDRWGGATILGLVFGAAALLSIDLTSTSIVPFTIGALGVAAVIGLGNGAVFKLVAQYFPDDTGTVTGLVGATGGLGGFFPPLVLGVIKSRTGEYAPGFMLLTLFCVACLGLNWWFLLRRRDVSATATAGRVDS